MGAKVNRLEAFINNSQLATIQLTENNIVTGGNPQFTKIFGFEHQDVAGKPIDYFIAPPEYIKVNSCFPPFVIVFRFRLSRIGVKDDEHFI